MSTLRFGGGPAAVLHETRARFASELRARLWAPHWVRSELEDGERERLLDELMNLCSASTANAITRANELGRHGGTLDGVPMTVERLRESTQGHVQIDSLMILSGSQIAEVEAVQLSKFVAKLFDVVVQEHIAEAHRIGVNHAATQEDHDRPTMKVTPPWKE